MNESNTKFDKFNLVSVPVRRNNYGGRALLRDGRFRIGIGLSRRDLF